MQLHEGVFRTLSNTVQDGAFCEFSERVKAINHFRITLHLRCLTGFSIDLCAGKFHIQPVSGTCGTDLIVRISRLIFTFSNPTIEALEKRCKLCSKLTIKAPELRPFGVSIYFTPFSSVSIVEPEQVNGSWVSTNFVGKFFEVDNEYTTETY